MGADTERSVVITNILAVCLFLLFVGSLIHATERQERAIQFFSGALSEFGIEETVTVGGKEYVVSDGGVQRTETVLTRYERYNIMRLAYAAAIVRRSPLLGLAGTDPDELERQAARLAVVQQKIAVHQQNAQERAIVAHSLYPISLLNTLADAERARIMFISGPSEDSLRAYHTALRSVIRSYEKNIAQFSTAFEQTVPEKAATALLSGTVTKQSMLLSLNRAEEIASILRHDLLEREECLLGIQESCRRSDLWTPNIVVEALEEDLHASQELANEVAALTQAAVPPSVFDHTFIALYDSVCAATFPRPHRFIFYVSEPMAEEQAGRPLRFIGDGVFYPIERLLTRNDDPRDPVAFLRKAGLRYVPAPPEVFYLCPLLAQDVSAAHAIRAAYTLAYPDVSFGEMELDEMQARRAVQDILDTNPNNKEALDIALMFADHGAGLHAFVGAVAVIQESVIKQREAGILVDTDARWQFMTRSAAASLFLFHHRALNSRDVTPFDLSLKATRVPIVTWSELRETTQRDEIIRSMKIFYFTHFQPEEVVRHNSQP